MSVPSTSKNAATGNVPSAPLDDQRDPLSAADAERRHAEPRVAVLHRVEERHQHPRAARADGMAEGDGTAVHVDAILRDAELAQDAERLRGERLVQLPEVDFLATQTRLLERLLRGRPRAHAHDRRVDAGR